MNEGIRRATRRQLLALGLAAGLAVIGAAPATAAQTYLDGIDVSHHNGQPVWDQVATDDVRFVFAKASESTTWRDGEYARNKAQAEAQGMAFGAYHFARPDLTVGDAVAEARNFVAAAALTGKNLLPVLDLEASGGLGRRKLVAWAKAWLGEVRARLGVKAIIYSSPAFWKDHMGNSRWYADNGYRLWVAHWGADTPAVPASNWGGRGWTFWQFDNCATVAGIDGCVDRDHYAGTGLGPVRIKNNR